MKRFRHLAAACALLGLAYAAPASATLIYSLDASNCCGSGPFGSVTLQQTGANVLVTVALNAGNGFIDTGAGDPLLFNIIGFPSLSVTGLTPGFTFSTNRPSLTHADGSGNWMYSILCAGGACGPGGSSPFFGSFSFTVLNVLETSFVATNESNDNFFAVDICFNNTANGCTATGDVWTNTPVPGSPPRITLPEPGSLALLGIAMLAFGAARRVRKT